MLCEVDDSKIFQAFLGDVEAPDFERFGIDKQNPSSVDRALGIEGLWNGIRSTHHCVEWRLAKITKNLAGGETERSVGFNVNAGTDKRGFRIRYFPELWQEGGNPFYPLQGASLYLDKDGEEVTFNTPLVINVCRMGEDKRLIFSEKEGKRELVIDPRKGSLKYGIPPDTNNNQDITPRLF